MYFCYLNEWLNNHKTFLYVSVKPILLVFCPQEAWLLLPMSEWVVQVQGTGREEGWVHEHLTLRYGGLGGC